MRSGGVEVEQSSSDSVGREFKSQDDRFCFHRLARTLGRMSMKLKTHTLLEVA
jgi:hypothetical protein